MTRFFVIVFCLFFLSGISSAQSPVFTGKQTRTINAVNPSMQHQTVQGNAWHQSELVHSGNSYMNTLPEPAVSSALSASKTQTGVKVYNGAYGLPIFIHGSPSSFQLKAAPTVLNEQSIAFAYLNTLSTVLKLSNPAEQFIISSVSADPLGGKTVRLTQSFQSIPVYGCESVIHLNAQAKATSWNGSYILPEQITQTSFPVSSSTAASIGIEHIQQETHYRELSEQEKRFLEYAGPDIQKVFYTDDKLVRTCVPAYIVSIRPDFVDWWTYIIDANTGNILNNYSNTCHADGPRTATATDLNGVSRTVNSYLKGSTYYMLDASRPMFNAAQSQSILPDDAVGAILTLNMNNTWGDNTSYTNITSSNNTWTDPKAVSAQFIAGKAYEYYKTIHNRNSIDGLGGTIISFINVADPNDGTPMDNAFWNGKAMFYGNGNTYFKPLAGGLDVGGHELTHGVVQNTANLSYQGESGAINESMADIFGCMVDSLDWTIGEDVVLLSHYPSGALRSLSDPHNGGTGLNSPGWQPKHVNEKYLGSGDNGGVHINSGIPNYAFYLLAQSTKRYQAEAIFYRTLSTYLTRSSQFIDLRLGCIQAAEDLYGSGSVISQKVGDAFDQVGIMGGSGSGTVYDAPVPVNPGTEFLLYYDLNPNVSTTLTRSNGAGSAATGISTTFMYNRASVTDDGSFAVFVRDDNKIISKNLTTKTETVIQSQSIWNNVAISKDGNRLAATTTDQDTSIYVYDFISEVWTQYILYNPTFSDGIKSGGPVYADALEWNHTGEYLMYDCYNEYQNTGGGNLSYWDVNFIKVWDNTLDDFGDGTVTKLFASLPEDISIGNPSYSKNSPHIIAFDYIDSYNQTYSILGCNIETNNTSLISAGNPSPGKPSYNRLDNRIAYGITDGSVSQVWYTDLNPDKISPLLVGGNPSEAALKNLATWPVYYANGLRDLPTGVQVQNGNGKNQTQASVFPNPCIDNINVSILSTNSGTSICKIYNMTGQLLYETPVTLTAGENTIPVQIPVSMRAGAYVAVLGNQEQSWVARFIKQ